MSGLENTGVQEVGWQADVDVNPASVTSSMSKSESHLENSENSLVSLEQTDLRKPFGLAYPRFPINSGPISP